MPLFKCTQCGVVENTALCSYWWRRYKKQPPLCSQCEDGEWHDEFPRQTPEEAGLVEGEGGFLEPPGGWPKVGP